ncbi:PepSY-associated TM helix domain-containing protein [Pseudomonas huanghezhanensis]|uniref:PepSY-associated TM helix domain-containing protein n=1 Tax=Pseudomonas huanghezhanensis TaxID=3002903 RepID=UPI002286132A|nr:PepSY-associated TM helix domain-containing protein [Pseudomonas sp. BSw22131]
MKEGFRQSMAWLHTWAGLVFGWLLFAIFLTGTLSYFKDEITQWAQPEVQLRDVAPGDSLDHAQRWLQQNAADSPRWFINLPDARSPGLTVMWQKPVRGFENKTLDPLTGTETSARETKGGEFFYRFHFQLQMPYPWGRWLAAIAAMVMLVTMISGVIIHKKIFKEFFTFRPRKGQRSWLDGHNAVGVLILPFHLMITYSSLVIFMTMVMPASILTAYGSDTQTFFNDLFPSQKPVQASGKAVPLAPLRPMMDTAREHWQGASIARLVVNRPGDANATVTFERGSDDRILYEPGSGMTFSGTTGAVDGESVMTAAPLMLAGGLYGLHMGHFAGPVLRWLYFVFGVGGTALIGTGLVMWLGKRRLKHAISGVLPFELRLVEVLNVASMAGLMLAVGSFFWANRLLPVGLVGRDGWEINVFFIMWGLALLHALLRKGKAAWREQLGLGALLFAGLPLLDALTAWPYLAAAVREGHWAIPGVDLTALVTGLFLGGSALKFRTGRQKSIASKLTHASGTQKLHLADGRGRELAHELNTSRHEVH